jgi:hypothetical protein
MAFRIPGISMVKFIALAASGAAPTAAAKPFGGSWVLK